MKTWKHCTFFCVFALALVFTACDPDKVEDDRYYVFDINGTKVPIYQTAEVTKDQVVKAVGYIQSAYYSRQTDISGKIKEIWIIKKTENEDRYFDYDETDDNRVIIKFQYDSPRTYIANTFGWMAEGTIDSDDIDPQLKIVEGFTFDNYPKVDGSTSAKPLNVLIACKLLGIGHQWVDYPLDDGSPVEWTIEPILRSKRNSEKFEEFVKTSQTHQSIVNLIDKKADIIISARKMSPDEKTYADAAGVTLIETPVALDAFIFIVNPNNPITTLTVKQIQDIYTGKITNWNEVGGNNEPMNPYVRNPNSGSQELMESMVMKDLVISGFPFLEEGMIPTMQGLIGAVAGNIRAIGYTVYYFEEYILRGGERPKRIGIEGIHPNSESIGNNSYPLTAEVYAVIRSDLDTSSTAYKLYELLQTETGKEIISESGYLHGEATK